MSDIRGVVLSQTTVTAIRALLYLSHSGEGAVLSPSEVAAEIGASMSYLSKVNTQLVRAGILKSYRGMKGGVALARPTDEISLLHIVQACQGPVLADYCTEGADLRMVCGFHRAMAAVHSSLVDSLRAWSLADIAARPGPSKKIAGQLNCVLGGVVQIGGAQ